MTPDKSPSQATILFHGLLMLLVVIALFILFVRGMEWVMSHLVVLFIPLVFVAMLVKSKTEE